MIRKLERSRFALALPVTFLILFVTTLGLVSVTYYFSVEKINSQSQMLKVSTARQDFQSLNEAILSTLWQPGSSATIDISDSGGKTITKPTNNSLTINVGDSQNIQETIFSSVIGKVIYELPYSSSSDTGLYLAGDSRTIANQTGSSLSQLAIVQGTQHPEIQLSYRPIISCAIGGSENGKTVNNIRIYIVNLNSSDSISLQGKLPLKISCIETKMVTKSYEVPYQLRALTFRSTIETSTGTVSIPISSTQLGAIINVEIVISKIAIQRAIM
jgi:hypothetical protein